MGFLQRTVLKQLQQKLQVLNPTLSIALIPDEHNPSMGHMLRTVSPTGVTIDVGEYNLEWHLYDSVDAIPTGVPVSTPATFSAETIHRLIIAGQMLATAENADSIGEINELELLQDDSDAKHPFDAAKLTEMEREIADIRTEQAELEQKQAEIQRRIDELKGESETPFDSITADATEVETIFNSAAKSFNEMSFQRNSDMIRAGVSENALILAVVIEWDDQPRLGILLFENVHLGFRINPQTNALVFCYETTVVDEDDYESEFESEEAEVRNGSLPTPWKQLDSESRPSVFVDWICTHLGFTLELAYREFESLKGITESKDKLSTMREMYSQYVQRFLDQTGLSFDDACDFMGARLPKFSLEEPL